jgi:hypothetical protein
LEWRAYSASCRKRRMNESRGLKPKGIFSILQASYAQVIFVKLKLFLFSKYFLFHFRVLYTLLQKSTFPRSRKLTRNFWMNFGENTEILLLF